MANETEFSNGVNVAAFLDPEIMDVLRAQITVLNWVRRIDFQRPSDSMKVRKRGTMTATTATESTDHAISEYTQTLLATLQVQEVKVYAELSDKGRDFSAITLEEMAAEAATAVIEYVEQATCGLFDGFSRSVGTTGVELTAQVLRRATYNLRVANVPAPWVIVLHPTQIDDVQENIQTAGAASWGNPNVDFSILNGVPSKEMGYSGSYLGCPIYSTTNIEGVNTNADWSGACLNPQRAIAFGEDGRGVRSEIDRNIRKGVTELAVSLFFDVKEAEDLSGVQILSAQ